MNKTRLFIEQQNLTHCGKLTTRHFSGNFMSFIFNAVIPAPKSTTKNVTGKNITKKQKFQFAYLFLFYFFLFKQKTDFLTLRSTIPIRNLIPYRKFL